MPTFNADKLIAELKQESKQTELDLSCYTKLDEKAELPSQPIQTLTGDYYEVCALAVLPDGRFISGTKNGAIKLWDEQGQCLDKLTGHSGCINTFAVLPDGRFLSGSSDKTIRLWDTQGKWLKTLTGHSNAVSALVVLPDGNFIGGCRFISGSWDNTNQLWDKQGKHISTCMGHGRSVLAMAVFPDGRFLTGSSDTTINLLNCENLRTFKAFAEHSHEVRALAVLPDGRFISGSQDKTIKLWDVKGQCLDTLKGHENGVNALAVLPDGRFLSGSSDNTIKLWNAQGKCLKTFTGHKARVNALAVFPDGRFISGSDDSTIKLWQSQPTPQPLCLKDIAPVLTALVRQKSIQKLNLQKMKLDDNAVPVLLKALQAAVGLKQIDIRETSISASGAKILHQGLANKEILHPAMAEILQTERSEAEKLQREKTERDRQKLQQQRAAQQKMAEEADAAAEEAEKEKLAADFSDPLQNILSALQNENVLELDLSQEKIFDEAVQGYLRSLAFQDLVAFFEMLQTNCSLKKLSLQACVLGDEAIMTLAAVLNTNTTLAELNLTNTGITKQGIKELQQELKTRKGFLELRHESSLVPLTLGSAAVEEKIPEVKQALSPAKNAKSINVNAEEKHSKKPEKSPEIAVSYVIKYDELKLGKKLGQGGFGVVYQATWRHHDVAVKQLLNQKLSDGTLEEFKTETQVMARLRSSSIVQFYGYCESPQYCLVMEYMAKGSLYHVLHSSQTLDWSVRYQIATDIARGVAFLHQENILHRDIKSLNVLLNNHMEAKLTDFGLSKIKKESQTTTKGSVGTVAWMAPELFERKGKYTQKSDIYSMGITFWEIASRQIPFEDAESQAVIPNWVTKGERPDDVKDCPKKLASLIKFCWAGDADKRPSADNVVTYLRSEADDFAQFTAEENQSKQDSATNSSPPNYRSNLASTTPSNSSYEGNLHSYSLRK